MAKVQAWQQALAESNKRQVMAAIQASDTEIQQAMIRAMNDIDKQVAALSGPGIGATVRRAQYLQTKAAIGESIETLWADDIDTAIRNGIREASDVAVQSNKAMFGFLANASPGVDQDLARSFYASQLGTWRNLQSRVNNAIPLSTNVYKNQALMSGKIDSIVNSGLLAGSSAREIADNVQKYINPKVMGGTRYAAMRLSRTEINNAAHTTQRETWKASPYVDAVRWFLSGSHPRPDSCDAYSSDDSDNLGAGVFKPDNVPDKPHPQCFCFIAPITITPKQFVDNLTNGVYDDQMSDYGFSQAAMCH